MSKYFPAFRYLLTCTSLLFAIHSPPPAHAQSAFPAPLQITAEETGTRVNDIYAPRILYQTIHGKQTLVMYFGGWYRTDPSELPNDSIYRSVCSAPNVCGAAQKVIDPVASKLGSAAMINNPTIVEMHSYGQDYFIMYSTVVTGNDRNNGATVENNKIYYSVSWANDGVNWSVPVLLLDNAWLPSATIDAAGTVFLYANTNGNSNPYFLARFNLGVSGVGVSTPEQVTTDTGIDYANVEVKYRPDIKLYQMVAQQASESYNSEVDYLDSVDGLHFVTRARNIIQPGMTPAVHPDTSCWVYYGLAPETYKSNIFLKSWC